MGNLQACNLFLLGEGYIMSVSLLLIIRVSSAMSRDLLTRMFGQGCQFMSEPGFIPAGKFGLNYKNDGNRSFIKGL